MTKSATSKKAEAVEAYNRVVENAELESIRLVSSNFVVKPEYFLNFSPGNWKNSFNSNFVDTFFDRNENLLGAQIEWTVSVKRGNKNLLSTKAIYLIAYSNVPEVEEEHCMAFVRRVGRFSTYPYFRALVSRYSAESNAELPILPVLK
ncbi:hypothetical protein [Pelagibacterium luteolum]|uniref:Uncharacterized protein n=1 Tax=Pelagibacterium luteolum TaxID=440168 RepID=A0A1G7UPJ2_9HYPH|nr:hypothetical protein [Pelagibacterium luteolum]SDG49515.1 hypothetical protein SAMN04487974_103202 [Pelagibacterium luteolum]